MTTGLDTTTLADKVRRQGYDQTTPTIRVDLRNGTGTAVHVNGVRLNGLKSVTILNPVHSPVIVRVSLFANLALGGNDPHVTHRRWSELRIRSLDTLGGETRLELDGRLLPGVRRLALVAVAGDVLEVDLDLVGTVVIFDKKVEEWGGNEP